MDFQKLFQIIPKEPRRWTQSDVEQWLTFAALTEFKTVFQQHAIDGACLEVLNEDDLNELGIGSLGVGSNIKRKKLLHWIQNGFQEYKLYVRSVVGSSEWQIQSKAIRDKENFKTEDKLEYTPIQKVQEIVHKPMQQHIQESFPNHQVYDSFADKRVELIESQKPVQAPYLLETTKVPSYAQETIVSGKTMEIISFNDNKHFKIDQKGARIGRGQENTIILNEDYISRNHCQIIYESEKFYLTDTGSSSGTFVLLSSPSLLREGLILHMGSNQYKIASMSIQGSQMDVVLRVFEGEHKGQKFCFSLKKDVTVLKFGRNLEQFRSDTHLSTNHAKFYYTEGLVVEDMESRNGVWLRLSEPQCKSEKIRLNPNRQFRLGFEKVFDCQ